MPNCINSGYYNINSDKNGTCKRPNGFSLQLCDKLRDSGSDCTNSNDNIAGSASKTLSESGRKNFTHRIKPRMIIKCWEGQKYILENGFEIKYRIDKSPASLCLFGNYSCITPTSEDNEVIVLYTNKNENDSFEL
uniref:Uncharacterized protein n=1 Tax=Strongyloides papillosus TaxID=174720 RepID=A0A0N5C5N1_STREA